jgi:hypothetical protein
MSPTDPEAPSEAAYSPLPTDETKGKVEDPKRLLKSLITEFIGTGFLMLTVALVNLPVRGLPGESQGMVHHLV